MSLCGGLAAARNGTLHCWNGDRFESTVWSQVSAEAEQMTRGLRNAGVEPGAQVAAILTNTPLAVRGILGVWLAGGTLASFPIPSRGMELEEYSAQLATLVEHLRPAVMFVDEAMIELLPPQLRLAANVRSWESVADSGSVAPAPPGEDDVSFIQYSSGSTSQPKGCMLTGRAIERQIHMILDMVEVQPSDITASWLPLSHDMGLFGNLLSPWYSDTSLVLSRPERFIFSPWSWFNDIATFGATITTGTNTALALAARRQTRRREARLNLHTMILGAERIEWDTLQSATEALGSCGLTPKVLMPAYGLAEATLAVTATRRDEEPRTLTVDAIALAGGQVQEVEPEHPAATAIVSAGQPLPGVELPGLGELELHEIAVRSPSLAVGYLGDEQRTRERFRDGAFLTGDLGFSLDGRLYPVGRMDDVISIGGRKVYSREIEAAIESLAGVRAGCSTIVETRDAGAQRLTLLLEVRGGAADYPALADEAARLAMAKGAMPLDCCLFIERGSLPKTPSGKIQRYRCRESLREGRLEPLATIELSAA